MREEVYRYVREGKRATKQVEPKEKIRLRGWETEGEFGCAYDVKHGPVIWRKFKALCRGNCIGVSMPLCAPFSTAFSFFTFFLFSSFCGFAFH